MSFVNELVKLKRDDDEAKLRRGSLAQQRLSGKQTLAKSSAEQGSAIADEED